MTGVRSQPVRVAGAQSSRARGAVSKRRRFAVHSRCPLGTGPQPRRRHLAAGRPRPDPDRDEGCCSPRPRHARRRASSPRRPSLAGSRRPLRPSRPVWPLDPRPAVVARLRPAGLAVGAPATAASTCSGDPASRCAPRSPGRSPSPARSPGAGSWWSTTAATRTTYEPVAPAVARRRPGRPRARVIGTLERGIEPLLPAHLPALGPASRARSYLDPLSLRRRRAGPAAAAAPARASGPGCACR